MNYSEAIEEALDGKKIRRSSWDNKEYHLAFGLNHCLRYYGDKEETISDNTMITKSDVSATDWEIYDNDTWDKFDDDFFETMKKSSTVVMNDKGEIFVNYRLEREDLELYKERASKLIKRFGEKK